MLLQGFSTCREQMERFPHFDVNMAAIVTAVVEIFMLYKEWSVRVLQTWLTSLENLLRDQPNGLYSTLPITGHIILHYL